MDPDKIAIYSKRLETLGSELSKNQFDFKIKDYPSEKYWIQRINEFTTYHKKTVGYFLEVQKLVKIFDEKESSLLLLNLSKLRKLGSNLIEKMETVKNNPSIMNSKDQQKSKWTEEQRENLIKANDEILNLEKNIHVFFRQFYEKHMKKD